MLMYIEKNFPAINGRRMALLDTHTIQTNLDLEQLLGAQQNNQDLRSMIWLEYMADQWGGAYEGRWYEVEDESFDGAEYMQIQPDQPSGLIARASIVLARNGLIQSRHVPENQARGLGLNIIYPAVHNPEPNPNILFLNSPNNILLSVIDCGQGNWNEIQSDNNHLAIYDVGASISYTAVQVRNLVQQRITNSPAMDISIIISHWDIDHYQALLAFNAADLGRIRLITYPSQAANTQTYKRTLGILNNVGIPLNPLPPFRRQGRTIDLMLALQGNCWRLYRATTGSSRNMTGIVLSIEGPRKIALLTGDHHYDQIFRAIQGQYLQADVVLVVPHHGGYAGALNVNAWNTHFGNIEASISVGPNRYEHPFSFICNALTVLAGAQLQRTDYIGNIQYAVADAL